MSRHSQIKHAGQNTLTAAAGLNWSENGHYTVADNAMSEGISLIRTAPNGKPHQCKFEDQCECDSVNR
jgi:hypothetical protein